MGDKERAVRKEQSREKRGFGLPWLWGRSPAGRAVSADWLAEIFEGPYGWLARGLVGTAVVVNGALVTAWAIHRQDARLRNQVLAESRLPVRVSKPSFVGGLKTVVSPSFGELVEAFTPPSSEPSLKEESPEESLAGGTADAALYGSDKENLDSVYARSAKGASVKGRALGSRGLAGGGQEESGSSSFGSRFLAWSGTPAQTSGPGYFPRTVASRDASDNARGSLSGFRSGVLGGGAMLRRSAVPVRARSARAQLRFANQQSQGAKTSTNSEGSAYRADAAFQGQAVQPGSALGGPGVTSGGNRVAPDTTSGGGGPSTPASIPMGVPSAYRDPIAIPEPGVPKNATPWQDLLNRARALLSSSLVLAILGFLMLRSKTPWLQILGGGLIGLAIWSALMASSLGDKIRGKWGQIDQDNIIKRTADGAQRGSGEAARILGLDKIEKAFRP